MMTEEEVKKCLSDRKLEVVSERTGISYHVLWAFLTERSQGLRAKNFLKLVEYLEGGKE